MRIICTNLDDFIENLEKEPSENILRKTVYVSRTVNPVDGTKLTAVKFSVNFQASAIVNLVEENGNDSYGQYLLEFGEDCGFDYDDSTQEKKGSERCEDLRKRLECCCLSRGLHIRPGILDM